MLVLASAMLLVAMLASVPVFVLVMVLLGLLASCCYFVAVALRLRSGGGTPLANQTTGHSHEHIYVSVKKTEFYSVSCCEPNNPWRCGAYRGTETHTEKIRRPSIARRLIVTPLPIAWLVLVIVLVQ